MASRTQSAVPAGTRLTRQRRLVLEAVRNSDDHPTAGDVYRRVRRRHPGIAYATIYNALSWLVERGDLREFRFGDAATRYDRNRDRHDHAICTQCGALVDISVHIPPQIVRQVQKSTGVKITSHHVQFEGLCARCAA
jgi:Fe2+ or Zn2+ uptake regulation protein